MEFCSDWSLSSSETSLVCKTDRNGTGDAVTQITKVKKAPWPSSHILQQECKIDVKLRMARVKARRGQVKKLKVERLCVKA